MEIFFNYLIIIFIYKVFGRVTFFLSFFLPAEGVKCQQKLREEKRREKDKIIKYQNACNFWSKEKDATLKAYLEIPCNTSFFQLLKMWIRLFLCLIPSICFPEKSAALKFYLFLQKKVVTVTQLFISIFRYVFNNKKSSFMLTSDLV